jgi:hypothetical protein
MEFLAKAWSERSPDQRGPPLERVWSLSPPLFLAFPALPLPQNPAFLQRDRQPIAMWRHPRGIVCRGARRGHGGFGTAAGMFRDLGHPNAEILHLEAILAANIIAVLDEQKICVRRAHELTGFAAAGFSRVRQAKVQRFNKSSDRDVWQTRPGC